MPHTHPTNYKPVSPPATSAQPQAPNLKPSAVPKCSYVVLAVSPPPPFWEVTIAVKVETKCPNPCPLVRSKPLKI